MHKSRRLFLKLLMSATLKGLVVSSNVAAITVQPTSNRTLLAFLDTLIPGCDADALFSLIQRKAPIGTHQTKLLNWGHRWLDNQAKTYGKHEFHQLNTKQRVAIVQLAEQSKHTSIQYYFFYSLRRYLMEYHYSEPAVLANLGFTRPPQPLGYSQHDQAPS